MSLRDQFQIAIKKKGSALCAGFDPDPEQMRRHWPAFSDRLWDFCELIIPRLTSDSVALKVNSAFFESWGLEGWQALLQLHTLIAKDCIFILDAKRGDIGNTAAAYAKWAFELVGADIVTVNPYMGIESLEPFLQRDDKGVFVLARTSNSSSDWIQEAQCRDGDMVYASVFKNVARWRDQYPGFLSVVVGANRPQELNEALSILGQNSMILVPGYGAQGGDVAVAQKFLKLDKLSLCPNVSRDLLFSSDNPNDEKFFMERLNDWRQQFKI